KSEYSMMHDPKLLHELARRYGTPLYVYFESAMQTQFEALTNVLGGIPHTICFAVKANSNLGVIAHFKKLGSGFDIVSEGELRRLKAAGADPGRAVFSGVAKTESEIEYALGESIRIFNVESASELRLIEAVAKRTGKTA